MACPKTTCPNCGAKVRGCQIKDGKCPNCK